MPTLALTNFNIVITVLGGWISLFGLVSYLCKENFYLSETLISLLVGVALSPHAGNLVRPLEYAGDQETLNAVTLAFSRLVLGVQLVLAGVQLPSRYLRTEWKPMSLLIGPVMACMWLASSLLIFALVPNLPFLHALAIGACVTPTDPVLANVIVKGKFADNNIPQDLQNLIISESGANDGLGYPFLFFALYLIKYIGDGGQSESGGVRTAMGLWFGETWGYTILLSVVYGAGVGWLAKTLLRWAERRKYVDRESFLVFAFSLAIFITGTCGMLGSDDVLACFIAGNTFTWDDWFRLETMDDSLQPTIDMLLNVTIFMWYGAVCPWPDFVNNNIVPIYRLVALGICILLFRRLPFVFAVHKIIPQIVQTRQAIFVGFFGPIGVSAIFYLYVTMDFVNALTVDGLPRPDVSRLAEEVYIVVWFIAICSITVHGLSIPLGKLGYLVPRTLSRGFSMQTVDEDDPTTTRLAARLGVPFSWGSRPTRSQRQSDPESGGQSRESSQPAARGRIAYQIGGTVIRGTPRSRSQSKAPIPNKDTPELIKDPQPSSQQSDTEVGDSSNQNDVAHRASAVSPVLLANRTIRFPDETRPRTPELRPAA